MRTLPEIKEMIKLTQADYRRDVARLGRQKAGYIEGILIGLLFSCGKTMAEAHEEVDRILQEQGRKQ